MPSQSNLKYADLDDINVVEAERADRIEEALLQAEPDSSHARYLQQLLVEAYTETAAEEKLPRPLRVAVILGLTSGLWMLIAAGALAIV